LNKGARALLPASSNKTMALALGILFAVFALSMFIACATFRA
jgi:hypothetical protein